MTFQYHRLFITGPTYLSDRVKDAAMLPEFGHRDKESALRLAPAMENLRKIAQVNENYSVLLIPGTGSSAMESSVRSLIRDDDTVLCASVGAFGDLFYEIAKSNKPKENVHLLAFEPGKAINCHDLEDKLCELRPDVLIFTHNETSTGVTNDVEVIGRIAKRYGAFTIVDGVSIFGGAPSAITEGDIDAYVTSTQKCLALPAGFGIAFVKRFLSDKIKDVDRRGYTTDLLEHIKSAEKYQTLTTTSSTLANQLYVQTKYIVEEEGIKNRFDRHRKMREQAHAWIGCLPEGFHLLPDAAHASPSLSCVSVPISLDRNKVKELMKQEGYLFDAGYGKLPISTIRIAHMGDISEEMLGDYMQKVKNSIDTCCEKKSEITR